MGKASRNEQKKLKATWCNSISAALISVGLLGPLVARILGALASPIDLSLIVLLAMGCLIGSALLHLAGQIQLWELED